jgi:hypothetical protein
MTAATSTSFEMCVVNIAGATKFSNILPDASLGARVSSKFFMMLETVC